MELGNIQFFHLKHEKFPMKSVVDIFIHFIREFLFLRSVHWCWVLLVQVPQSNSWIREKKRNYKRFLHSVGLYPRINFFEKNIQINCSSRCHAVTPTTTSLLALTQHPIVIHLKMEERIIGSKRQKVCAANPEWNIRQTINLREKHENDHNIVFDRMKEPRVEIIILVVS